MPYVDLFAQDDFAQLFYRTNTSGGIVSDFDAEKPTLVLLHPLTFDSSWTDSQLDDPRLGDRYNIIAFDSRFSGRSRTKLSGKLDYWVQAADLAYAFQLLRLPPAHIWAEETESTCVAMRFAILFPEMCLSLALVSVPSPTESSRYMTSADELVRMWGLAESMTDLEHANSELIGLTVGHNMRTEELDQVVSFWQQTYPPSRRSRLLGLMTLALNRVPLTSSQLECIRRPVLLLHGGSNEHHPLKHAEQLQTELRFAEGGARLGVVRGCGSFLSLSSSSILNQFYVKFLATLPPARSDLSLATPPISERMASALKELSEIAHNPSVQGRDPNSSLSFSLVPPETEKLQMDAFTRFFHGQHKTMSPLRPDGHPIREYSSRHDGHWFSSDDGGFSTASTNSKVNLAQRSTSLPTPRPPHPSNDAAKADRQAVKPSSSRSSLAPRALR